MSIGLCGSHRVGKTTLASVFAEMHGMTFVRTSATEVFEALGRDPKVNYPIEERIAIQEAIMYAFEKQYAVAEAQGAQYIADRTPLDLASYMIADVQRETLKGRPELSEMVVDYLDRCIASTDRWFSTVVLVQPGIPLQDVPGKAAPEPAYIEHLNLILSGLMTSEKLMSFHYKIPRRYVSMKDRLEALRGAANSSAETCSVEGRAREASGIPVH